MNVTTVSFPTPPVKIWTFAGLSVGPVSNRPALAVTLAVLLLVLAAASVLVPLY